MVRRRRLGITTGAGFPGVDPGSRLQGYACPECTLSPDSRRARGGGRRGVRSFRGATALSRPGRWMAPQCCMPGLSCLIISHHPLHCSTLIKQASIMPFGDPTFTVVNPSPDVDQTLRSLRFSDWFTAAAISGGAWGYGYVFGKPIRMANASTGLALGMTCASMMLLQVSASELSLLFYVSFNLTAMGSRPYFSEWKVEASGIQGEC